MAGNKGRSILWDNLNRGTAGLYRIVENSFVGLSHLFVDFCDC